MKPRTEMYHFVAKETTTHSCLPTEVPVYTLQYLKCFQVAAIRLISEKLRDFNFCILNDESGLGKSVTVVGFLSTIGRNKRVLIVLPSEEKFLNDWRFHFQLLSEVAVCPVTQANDLDARAHNIYLTPWNILHKISNVDSYNFDYIILDDRGNVLNNRFAESMLSKYFLRRVNIIISSTDVTSDVKLVHSILKLGGVLHTEMTNLKKFKEKFNFPNLCDIIDKKASIEDYYYKRLMLNEYIKDFHIRRYRYQYAEMLPLVDANVHNANIANWIKGKKHVDVITRTNVLELCEVEVELDMPPLVYESESEEELSKDTQSFAGTIDITNKQNNCGPTNKSSQPRKSTKRQNATKHLQKLQTRSMKRVTRSANKRPTSKYMDYTLELISDRKFIQKAVNEKQGQASIKSKRRTRKAQSEIKTQTEVEQSPRPEKELPTSQKVVKKNSKKSSQIGVPLIKDKGLEPDNPKSETAQLMPQLNIIDSSISNDPTLDLNCNSKSKGQERARANIMRQSPVLFSSESEVASGITPSQAANERKKAIGFPGFKVFGTQQTSTRVESPTKNQDIKDSVRGHACSAQRCESVKNDKRTRSVMPSQDLFLNEDYEFFDVTNNNEFGSRLRMNASGAISPVGGAQRKQLLHNKITNYLIGSNPNGSARNDDAKDSSGTPTQNKKMEKPTQTTKLTRWFSPTQNKVVDVVSIALRRSQQCTPTNASSDDDVSQVNRQIKRKRLVWTK